MLDHRIYTFLTLCEKKSYTKTAEALYLTQPAVTQQIQHLEKQLGVKLIRYEGRQLELTRAGKQLHQFALTMARDAQKKTQELAHLTEQTVLRFGASMTIGEYVMPNVLAHALRECPNERLSMRVDNTEGLLHRLREGEIDFALVEGYFDKNEYAVRSLGTEEFLCVCAAQSSLAQGTYALEDLYRERLILREEGSGTRDIFERILYEHNRDLSGFHSLCEVGSMHVVLALVAQGLGVSFLYRRAAQAAMERGLVKEVQLRGFPIEREFHFVCLKGSSFEQTYVSKLEQWRTWMKLEKIRQLVDK